MTGLACAWSTVVFLSLAFQSSPAWSAVARLGYFPDSAIYEGKPWALLTSAFVHIEPLHFLFNLYWLWVLGRALEASIGSLRWAVFVLAAAWISGGIQLSSGQSGIGLSGVGYALFGFGWAAGPRFPELRRVVQHQTVVLFVVWGVICVITTQLGIMNVGNLAHGAGLAFGLAAGFAVASPQLRLPALAGMFVLTAASFVPLVWNPRSIDWVASRAQKAHASGNLKQAADFYRRTLSMGADPAWVWVNLANVYGNLKDKSRFDDAIGHLERLDPEAANAARRAFSDTSKW
jgi:membrane associated rhomboid family serine protease